MRGFLVLALAALGTAAEPQLTSTDSTPLAYDLAASEPWMPLLWRDLGCTFAGAARIEISARLVSGSSGAPPDASDLLALRDGHRLHLDGTTVQVAGAEATWSGPVSGAGELLVTTTQEVDAATAYLILRQLCYANCGGPRVLAPRRVEVRLRIAGGTWSPALAVAIAPAATDAPPLMRYDPLTLTTGGSVDVLPHGWYDGRTPVSEARWQLDLVSGASLTQNLGNGRVDATADLAAVQDWSEFSSRRLLLEAGNQTATGSLRLRALDAGGLSSMTTTPITTIAPAERLLVIGDFPFAISGLVTLHFVSNLPDTILLSVLPHPDGSQVTPLPTGSAVADGVMVTVDPHDAAAGTLLCGTAIFSAQEQQVGIPYRIVVQGTAQ
jgi:hypothetical protein